MTKTKEIKMGVSAALEGRFTLQVSKEPGVPGAVVADFKNTVLNSGIDSLLTHTGFNNNVARNIMGVFRVGSSSIPEDPEQTALGAQFASVGTGAGQYRGLPTITVSGTNPRIVNLTFSRQFGAGAAAGIITEVGVGWTSGPDGGLFARALVKDALGNPTAIEVLSDEYLTITYSLDIHIDVTPKPFTLNLSSGDHDGEILPRRLVAQHVGDMSSQIWGNANSTSAVAVSDGATVSPTSTGDITGTRVFFQDNYTLLPYTPGSLFRDVRLNIGLGQGNIAGGFSALRVDNDRWVSYQMSFDPPIPKDADRIFRIVLRYSFARL